MKNTLIKFCVFLCATLIFSAAPAQSQSTIASAMDESVIAFRKIIVLMDGSSALDEGNRERVRNAAWILFEKNQERLKKLEDDLGVGLAMHNARPTEEFLTHLESNPDYRDADKLTFRDLLDGVATSAKDDNAGAPLQKRIADDVAALEEIHGLYQKEITQIFAGLETRGMPVHRQAWQEYVAFLKTKYQREQLLKESQPQLPPAESRGGAKKKNGLEMFGTDMPPKTIALTFDDGPHPRYTDQILAILKKYGLQAVFFEVGQNLGTITEKNEVKLGPIAPASYRILEAGSYIGNHSYSHPVLPKLSEAGYTK